MVSGMNLRVEQSWKEGGVAGCAAPAISVQPLGSLHCTSNIVALVWVERCLAEYHSITLDAPAISV